MKIGFTDLNKDSRIWIYTSPEKINESQHQEILNLADQFLKNWQSHGKDVDGTVEIIEGHFVIIAADSKGDTLCGRAVDANVRFIKEIQDSIGLNLTDRMVVIYKQNGELISSDYHTLKKEIESGNIETNSVVYNPLVSTIKEYNNSFEQAPANCWIA